MTKNKKQQLMEEPVSVDIQTLVDNQFKIIESAHTNIGECFKLVLSKLKSSIDAKYLNVDLFQGEDKDNIIKVFISQPMKGLTNEQILERKKELLNVARLSTNTIQIVNDYSKCYAKDYKGEKPYKGDTLAWSLLSMKEAEYLIFDKSDNFGCATELGYLNNYLASDYKLNLSTDKNVLIYRKIK